MKDKNKQKEVLQQEVKELIATHINNKNESQEKLAENIGVSNGTISNVLNEQWERLSDTMLLKLRSFFKKKGWQLIETTNFLNIQNQCDKARYQNLLVGIIGYSGAGKTTALRTYYQANPSTYLVTCARTMRTKQFLAEVLRALGSSYLASDYEMVRKIISKLNKMHSPLLIIDEASKLSPNALMYLQDIWDGVEDNAGIIIAGVEYLLTNLKKASDKNKIGMPEFYGRVSSWMQLVSPTRVEIRSIAENNGITSEKEIKNMYRLSNFRYVRNSILNIINQ
ncbi:ATP-binding protein [Tenacibaculum maritimum]|nr:ATP-binding protein [Tenacibaculum maritimum]MDB0601605.1 ATP-binding protein [Tenacibaculum maritimum]MDB0601620.1 ATP-binding protein [Tenacibaculum maritimum]MDB0601671.1 ATP-binding protein [Tenacibaculum maritimum]MDB0612858.1 ATP-binding protein [Tenacibaculum maritimum]